MNTSSAEKGRNVDTMVYDDILQIPFIKQALDETKHHYYTTRDALPTLLQTLRAKYDLILIDIVVVDRLHVNGRFYIHYVFLSLTYNVRVIVTVFTNETLPVPSIRYIFPSAGWLEREAWDMFGIYFPGHGDLRRILTDYGFAGHPLRKDFPVSGFREVAYNDAEGRVTSAPIELSQEFRALGK